MKEILLVLMEDLVHQKKGLILVLVKQTQKFEFHYNADNSYFLVNGKEIFKFKFSNKNANFPTQFCLGSISNGFSNTESIEEMCMIFHPITILLINLT